MCETVKDILFDEERTSLRRSRKLAAWVDEATVRRALRAFCAVLDDPRCAPETGGWVAGAIEALAATAAYARLAWGAAGPSLRAAFVRGSVDDSLHGDLDDILLTASKGAHAADGGGGDDDAAWAFFFEEFRRDPRGISVSTGESAPPSSDDAPEATVVNCFACGTYDAANSQVCQRCKAVHFCGPACLRAGWKRHKPHCVPADAKPGRGAKRRGC